MIKFVIFASARIGSSSFAEVLGESKDVKLSFEPFHPKYPQWNPGEENYSKLIKDKESMNTSLDELFAKFNTLKVLDYQLPQEIYFELLKRKDIKVLFLRRKNLLQMAISAMVAHQTGEWRKSKDDKIYQNLKPLNIKEIQKRMDYTNDLNNLYLDYLEKVRKDDYMQIWYEELYSEDLKENIFKLQEISDYLKISLPPLHAIKKYMIPSVAKNNIKEIYNLIPNIEEVEQIYGKIF